MQFRQGIRQFWQNVPHIELILRVITLGLAVGLVMLLLSSLGVFEPLELLSLDLRFWVVRWNKTVKSDIKIVFVEKECRDKLLRDKYATLVDGYANKTKAIGFDLVLPEDSWVDRIWFSADPELSKELDKGIFPDCLRKAFSNNGYPPDGRVDISVTASIEKENPTEKRNVGWEVTDESWISYTIRREKDKLSINDKLNVYDNVEPRNMKFAGSVADSKKVYIAFAKLKGSVESPYNSNNPKKRNAAIKARRKLKEKSRWESSAIQLGKKPLERLEAEHILAPSDRFSKVAKGIGHAHTTASKGEVLRKVPLTIGCEIEGKECVYPYLALQIACDFLHVREENIHVQLGKHIRLVLEERKLFDAGGEVQSDLNNGVVPEALRESFKSRGIPLSDYLSISIEEIDTRWLIDDGDKSFSIKRHEGKFEVCEKGKWAIEIPIDEDGSMYINYVGKFKDNVSILEDMIARDDWPATDIVLVGAGAEDFKEKKDLHKTPLGDHYGVEIQANVIDNIIRNDFLYPIGNWNGVIPLILGLAVGGIWVFRPLSRDSWLTVLFTFYAILSFIIFYFGYWIEFVTPLSALAVIILGYLIHDLRQSDSAESKRLLITLGFSSAIALMLVLSVIMTIRGHKEFGSTIIGTLITSIGAVIVAIITSRKRN